MAVHAQYIVPLYADALELFFTVHGATACLLFSLAAFLLIFVSLEVEENEEFRR